MHPIEETLHMSEREEPRVHDSRAGD